MMEMTELTPEQSKLFFGNSHMSSIAIEIASIDDTFSAKQIIANSGLLPSVVTTIFHKLRDAELITFVGSVPGERTKLYRINNNPWWQAARDYASARDYNLAPPDRTRV